jgi:hypothetical protein
MPSATDQRLDLLGRKGLNDLASGIAAVQGAAAPDEAFTNTGVTVVGCTENGVQSPRPRGLGSALGCPPPSSTFPSMGDVWRGPRRSGGGGAIALRIGEVLPSSIIIESSNSGMTRGTMVDSISWTVDIGGAESIKSSSLDGDSEDESTGLELE